MSLFTYPIVTTIVNSRVFLRPSHLKVFLNFLHSPLRDIVRSGRESLQLFHSIDPHKLQLNHVMNARTAQ